MYLANNKSKFHFINYEQYGTSRHSARESTSKAAAVIKISTWITSTKNNLGKSLSLLST